MITALEKQPAYRTSDDIKLILPYIRNIKLFQEHKDSNIDATTVAKIIAERIEFKYCKQGEILFNAGDIGQHFYIILEGEVAVLEPTEFGIDGCSGHRNPIIQVDPEFSPARSKPKDTTKKTSDNTTKAFLIPEQINNTLKRSQKKTKMTFKKTQTKILEDNAFNKFKKLCQKYISYLHSIGIHSYDADV